MSTSLPQLSFADGPPVPDLVQAELDEALLAQLFVDLATHTEVLAVLAKGGPTHYAKQAPLTLEAGRELLLNRTVRALQIRYQYDGHEWSDTLMHLPSKVRLVRCRHLPYEIKECSS